MNTYFIILALLNICWVARSLIASDYLGFFGTVLVSFALLWLCSNLVRRKNWARVSLVILTFPLGLVIGLSRDVKSFIQQKG